MLRTVLLRGAACCWCDLVSGRDLRSKSEVVRARGYSLLSISLPPAPDGIASSGGFVFFSVLSWLEKIIRKKY